MPLFPNQQTPPTKKILLYIAIAVAVLLLVGYFFPDGQWFGNNR